ncbi:MAG: hypothetical protein HOJ35_09970 [Bdellovibrionales bacterium]|nr:hypothetical protein [Bdellovibrionales bacterium]
MDLKENNQKYNELNTQNIIITKSLPKEVEEVEQEKNDLFFTSDSLRPAKSIKRRSWIPRPLAVK